LTPVAEPLAVAHDLTIAEFDYDLPQELIAQTPLVRRDSSRLLVMDRDSGTLNHSYFSALGDWLAPGDLLVANNSRVIPARLRGVREGTGGAVEVLLLRATDRVWSALGKPAKRLQAGTRLTFPSHRAGVGPAVAVIEENLGEGEIRIRFEDRADDHLDAYGSTPLPPYIRRPMSDGDRYQTVYGTTPGSAAAPTAGLHFTRPLIEQLRQKGIEWAEVTLHVGLDTFRPVTEALVKDHRIHQEWCQVSLETARAIAACRNRGGRVVAVGTTAARTLETIGVDWRDDEPRGFMGMTDTFIVPGHRWALVDGMVTNFHLPRSTLLMLVSAFAGRDQILLAYSEAIRLGYRFYSFGDAMMIR
jgi:S-adenosylmethionine:tRNA ribosyltransferase-isomerase